MLSIPSFMSIASLYEIYLRRCFTAAGLLSQSIAVDDETTIHFWGPTSKSPNKACLVLIHGFGPMAIWQWRKQVQFFAPHFNVYVPDLVFFGGSTTRSSERSEKFQAAAVVKLVEKEVVADEESKKKKVHVIGTSYGGFVAYQVARMMGVERVGKVVIASSGVNMRKKDNLALLERAGLERIEDLMMPAKPQHFRKLMALSLSRRLHYLPDFFLADFINKLYSDNRKEKMELLKGVSLGREEALNISPLQQEVLIVWGEHDRIFPVQMARELREVIGKKASLEVIKDASHVPQIEKAAEFNNIILNFLKGCT
ncbi:uncharacterized protein LOC107470671 [Arachis duranensis]|uniref:AB hydrolase-1 domain-containing protein n=2 Tax=Arachis TaxID=3817 RepID=A0A445B4U0_ARAHY|nr:uncharacterized protein LOC107470671 [Arachis duranensis]XP_025623684.1 uncharacterized protein LOC112716058 [Arachis hypogaea]QHO16721.1 2-hydroxy-6-oxononadienedioate/2-hydroxy-6-oxononatrienedioate hydrolase [Arachis hypogaea]RYR33671.1 hypothetical protein Ahy_A10g048292 [Arachis hypogaea]